MLPQPVFAMQQGVTVPSFSISKPTHGLEQKKEESRLRLPNANVAPQEGVILAIEANVTRALNQP